LQDRYSKSLGINIIPIIGVSSQDHLLEDLQAHTRETRGFIDERDLKLMKPSSYLINVSRSFLVQEKPSAKALREGWIEGFASDVWFSYTHAWGWHAPVLSRERIHQMDNVIVSSHRSCAVKELKNQMIDAAVANVVAFATGKK